MSTLLTRKLANTGIELGELAVGTWGLCADSYGKVFDEQRTHTLARALEQGVRTFDMAPCWGADGLSERAVALAVGERRAECTYITRAGKVPHELGLISDFSAEGLRNSCEASLKRLDTDRIDVWLLHNPSEAELRSEEVRSTCEALQIAGKVRAWGASVASLEDALSALDVGAQVLCVPFSLLQPRILWDLESVCSSRNVALIGRSVLMYGMLAGRFAPQKRFSVDDHRNQRWSPEALTERVRQAGELRQVFTEAPPRTLAALSLRFALAHDALSCAIIGPRTPGQVESAVTALDGSRPLLSTAQLELVRRKLLAG